MQKVITLDANSLLVRAYARSWDADPKRADLCRMFWGLLFLPFAWLVVRPLDFVFVRIGEWRYRRRRDKWNREIEEGYPERRSPMVKRFLDWLTHAIVQGPVRYVVFALFGLLLLGAAAVLVWLAVTHVMVILKVLGVIAAIIVAGIIITAPIIWLIEHGKLSWLADILDGLGDFFRTLARVLYHGVKAVKTRTCPRIEVR